MKRSTQSAGGYARGIIQKTEALVRYMSNPTRCLFCDSIIAPDQKISIVRVKKFCNKSCAAKHNNLVPKRKKRPRPCKHCGENHVDSTRILCPACYKTKTMVVPTTEKRNSTHSKIRSHARYVLKGSAAPKACVVCGYSTFVECCHKKPVMDFDGCALLQEINDLKNLVWLCPNHHWEFDHGILSLG